MPNFRAYIPWNFTLFTGPSAYIRWVLFFFFALLISSCSSDLNPTNNRSTSSVDLELIIPAKLAQSVARVEYVVSGEGMEDLMGALAIVGNVARGTVVGIEPGAERLFVLNAYHASGALSHTGSATAEIIAGRSVEVRISLLPLSGAADVIGDFGAAPLFAKAREVLGTWRLNLGEDAEFSYSFRSDGRFENRVGGAFLSALRQLDQLQDLDLGQLDQFDGGTLVFVGTWTPGEGTLDLDFDELEIELFGQLPIVGKVEVGILRENLGQGAEFDLAFDCAVSGDELRIRGPALTLGVPLAVEDAASAIDEPFAEVSSLGRAALGQVGAVIGDLIGERNLDEVVLVRVE